MAAIQAAVAIAATAAWVVWCGHTVWCLLWTHSVVFAAWVCVCVRLWWFGCDAKINVLRAYNEFDHTTRETATSLVRATRAPVPVFTRHALVDRSILMTENDR